MNVSNKWGHLAKALLELTQDFANAQAVGKVYALFEDLLGNLYTNRAEMDRQNALEIELYEAFMAQSQDTIDQAEARIAANQADLDVVNAEIAHQEELRDTAEADRDQAQEDLDFETERWEGVQAAYQEYMAEL